MRSRDALLLEMPMRHSLQAKIAEGLCPRMRREPEQLGSCACQEGGEVTNPFSALKAFVQNNEEV